MKFAMLVAIAIAFSGCSKPVTPQEIKSVSLAIATDTCDVIAESQNWTTLECQLIDQLGNLIPDRHARVSVPTSSWFVAKRYRAMATDAGTNLQD